MKQNAIVAKPIVTNPVEVFGFDIEGVSLKNLTTIDDVCWETDIKIVDDPTAKPIDVILSDVVRVKIDALMKEYQHMEWLGYLTGREENGCRYIDDLLIPKQQASAVRVDVDGDVGVETIGVIHSHHDMGNSFSHTDDEYINQNNPLSLCVSKTGINGVVRVDNGDGNFSLVNANIITNDYGVDLCLFVEEAKKLITVNTYNPGDFITMTSSASKAMTLTASIMEYRKFITSIGEPLDVDIIELSHMAIIIDQFILDDQTDSYADNIDMFYADKCFEAFSVQSLDVIDIIEYTFSKNLSSGEIKALAHLLLCIKNITDKNMA